MLAPGESEIVKFALDRQTLAYWNDQIHDWHVDSGRYELLLGTSSAEIVYRLPLNVQ